MTRDLDHPAPREWTDEQNTTLRLFIALDRCHSTCDKAIAEKAQEYGLTRPQLRTLEALYHLGPLSLGELGDKLLVTGGNVTHVMDRLEEQGLAYRDRCSDDRRVVRATLTPAGRALLDEILPGYFDFIEHLSRHLTTEEQETMRALLKRFGKGIADNDLEGRTSLPPWPERAGRYSSVLDRWNSA